MTLDNGHRIPTVMIRHSGPLAYSPIQVLEAILRHAETRNLKWDIQRPSGMANDVESYQASKSQCHALPEDTRIANALAKWAEVAITELKNPYTINRVHQQHLMDQGQRWLVRFQSWREADRFARAWHMRPFPHAQPSTAGVLHGNGSVISPLVFAELLW